MPILSSYPLRNLSHMAGHDAAGKVGRIPLVDIFASAFGVSESSADNGPALQEAIDAQPQWGGRVILPSGLLAFKTGVIVPQLSNISTTILEGSGATIPYLSSGSLSTLFEFRNTNGILRNMYIGNFGAGTLTDAIFLNGSNGFIVDKVGVEGQDGIVTNAIRAVDAFGVQLRDSTLIWCAKGFFADGYSAHQLTVRGCYIGVNGYGIHNDFAANPVQQLCVANTTTQFNTTADFHLNGAINPLFYGNQLEGDPAVSPSTSIAFDFTGTVYNPTILNNLFAHRTEQFKNISLGDFKNNSMFNQNITFASTVAGLAVAGTHAIGGTETIAGPAALTVATLPPVAEVSPGTHYFVSDANATTRFSTVAGGGSNKVPVVSNGTNWIIA